jgi:predicted GNAT family acetyltransferase
VKLFTRERPDSETSSHEEQQMAVTLMRHESGPLGAFAREEPCIIGELSTANEPEVIEFLSARTIHTVFMSSLIRDNGLVSRHNRGSFYSCRDTYGRLEGVALLGHATLIETRSENALAAFARLARNCLNAHLIRGERETIGNFWKHYVNSRQEPRLVCREMLFEQKTPSTIEGTNDLRPATLKDLDRILAVNASMALQEGGTSPMQHDPGGFRSRTARRIEQGRIWVWVADDRLMFKADVVAETPEVTYLEGVHVHAQERRRGYGLSCLTGLSSILLARSQSICLTVNEKNKHAATLYEKAGYKFHSHYETIYLR